MRRALILALLLAAGLLWVQTRRLGAAREDNRRLGHNQTALMSEMVRYRNRWGEEVASKEVLQLRIAEFGRLRAGDAARIRELGIRLRRVEATATTASQTVVALRAALRDTVIIRVPAEGGIVRDTLRAFRWADPWVAVEGLIGRDSVGCRVESVDTLRQIVHRVPRRFLFFRWGTKAVRQEIISSNPHTRIVYTEYVKLKK